MKAPALFCIGAALLARLALAAEATPTSAPPHVTQVLSSREVKLGEPFELEVSVTHPRGQRWELAVPDGLGAFSVLGRSSTSTPEGGQQVDHLTLTLGLYELGKHLVPELELREKTAGLTLPLSHDAEVEAISALAPNEPRTLRDVAPPRPLYLRDPRKIAALLGGVLALVAAGVLAARWLPRAWRRFFPPESEEARDRRALGTLEALDDERFFDALDGILRRSLARWHGVAAVQSTAEEIIGALGSHPPSGVSLEALAEVLRESVLVRFAHRPTTAVRRRAALELCHRTFPVPSTSRGGSHARPALS